MGDLALLDALGAAMADGEVRLHPLSRAHRAALRAACALDETVWPIYSVSYDPEHFDASFDALLANPQRLPFAVIVGDALVGMTAFLDADPVRMTVEIGNTYYAPAVRGGALNARVKRLMLDRAFSIGIRRVEFRIDDRNGRSKAAVTKIGAVFEGIIRAERITWTGHVRDTALFSILKDEWFTAG